HGHLPGATVHPAPHDQNCPDGLPEPAVRVGRWNGPLAYDHKGGDMREAVIASAARTPIGSFNGGLASVHAAELAAGVIKEALARAGVSVDQVDVVFTGNVWAAGLGQNVARQAALRAGIPDSVPATAINQLCGSGLRTVALAAQQVLLGDADIVVACGTENMSA